MGRDGEEGAGELEFGVSFSILRVWNFANL